MSSKHDGHVELLTVGTALNRYHLDLLAKMLNRCSS